MLCTVSVKATVEMMETADVNLPRDGRSEGQTVQPGSILALWLADRVRIQRDLRRFLGTSNLDIWPFMRLEEAKAIWLERHRMLVRPWGSSAKKD